MKLIKLKWKDGVKSPIDATVVDYPKPTADVVLKSSKGDNPKFVTMDMANVYLKEAQKSAPKATRVGDDLTKIETIGKATEKTLKEHELTTFKQIATLSEDAIELFKLKPQAIESAKKLAGIEDEAIKIVSKEQGEK